VPPLQRRRVRRLPRALRRRRATPLELTSAFYHCACAVELMSNRMCGLLPSAPVFLCWPFFSLSSTGVAVSRDMRVNATL
jgi:hypothetical protein